MKYFIAILLSLSMILGTSIIENDLIDNSCSNVNYEDSGCINGELKFNADIARLVFKSVTDDLLGEDSTIYLSISPNKENAILRFEIDDEIIRETTLYGTYNTIETNNELGYIAVYEGEILPIPNCEYSLAEDEKVPIIVDVTFSDKDMFAVLTLGFATDNYNPNIMFFGNFTDEIKRISKKYADTKMPKFGSANQPDTYESNDDPLRIDATCKYKGTNEVYMGSHKAGALSVFHADEMENTGNMSVYAKVNTKSANVKDYLENDLGFSSIAVVYPDTFNISICGNHNNMHAVTNSYLPQNNSTSATISIPAYLPVIGLQFIPYSIIMSSTTITPSKYSDSSIHLNNRLTWNIYRQNGWNPWDFDGSHSTSTGMTVQSTYTYEGNVLGVITRSMTSTGSIRYEYWIDISGFNQAIHISTSTMNLLTTLLMYP